MVGHQPSEEVFDLEAHSQQKRDERIVREFFKELQATIVNAESEPEDLISQASKDNPGVLELALHYWRAAAPVA